MTTKNIDDELFMAIANMLHYGQVRTRGEKNEDAQFESFQPASKQLVERIKSLLREVESEANTKGQIEAFTHAIDIVTANADDEDMENRLNDLFYDEIKTR